MGNTLAPPFISILCQFIENKTCVWGCCGLRLCNDILWIFLSFHGKYEATTAVPVLFMTIYYTVYNGGVHFSWSLYIADGNLCHTHTPIMQPGSLLRNLPKLEDVYWSFTTVLFGTEVNRISLQQKWMWQSYNSINILKNSRLPYKVHFSKS